MGNLHAGHLSLVNLAREHAQRIVVSLFVNPTQFEPGGDYDAYPRTLEQDRRQLERAGVDLLFAPDIATLYPVGIANATRIKVPGLSDELCGAFRPGHFDGVTSVVLRLFTLIRPDAAVFGAKDYQQQVLVRRMVEDLHLDIAIVTAPTVRDADGLAFSSRNQYLTAAERGVAPGLYQVLVRVARELAEGARDHGELERGAMAELSQKGFRPDYVAVRRAADLAPPAQDTRELVVLAAAWLGKARLIDNVRVDL